MAVKIQFRRGTASQWTSYNPILSIGEFGYETDTRLFKVGDGTTTWNSLSYSASTITAVNAGTGLTGGGTTGSITLSVDSTKVVTTSLVDAKGDLVVGTANDTVARLPVGANGTKLVADSLETAGVKWVAETYNAVIDAKGDLLAGTANDTLAKLSVGSANSRLVADSSQTTGLKWVSDSVNTVIDAKGDILVGTADDTVGRVAVGQNGFVLTADSSQTSGVKWSPPSTSSAIVMSLIFG